MPRKTNCVDKSGNKRYRLQSKIGMRKNKHGDWVPQIKNFYGRCKQEAEEKYVEYCNAQASGQADTKFRCLGEAIDMYAHERENEIDREVANTMLKTIDEMKGKQE